MPGNLSDEFLAQKAGGHGRGQERTDARAAPGRSAGSRGPGRAKNRRVTRVAGRSWFMGTFFSSG